MSFESCLVPVVNLVELGLVVLAGMLVGPTYDIISYKYTIKITIERMGSNQIQNKGPVGALSQKPCMLKYVGHVFGQ